MNIQPLGDRVLVQRLEAEETKKGGIIIPETAQEKPMEARVITVGTGKVMEDGTKVDFEIKKGDRVLIGKYSGTDIKVEDVEYLILSQDDILAIIK
ncbi:MAG: co-chaperone GroES [Candidatus Euphemobacter frigidus]|nr:co-chaperone GroES [Candidatus Euphemobacter frigidus]MDP8275147.1 co-chaperone GroES [Candidatus Euphemobacter frigidus]